MILPTLTLLPLMAMVLNTVSASEPSCQVYAPPAASAMGFEYAGCFEDSVSNRALDWEWKAFGTMNVDMCLAHCKRYGYPVAGLQWCGDRLKYEKRVSDRFCNFQCDGNVSQCCGAPDRISLYVAEQSVGIAPVFSRPKNRGKFEFIFSGPVVPLVTGLTKTNKVIFLEKFAFIAAGAPPNSTHVYEYDYTITDRSKAFREMHTKTDIFCSAVHMMPDRWGRMLNVAGMRDISLKGIRIYRPTGSSGVNGTTDWEENAKILKLQRPRWYPGMLQLQNGSFAIIGGADNADLTGQSPSAEILPPNGFPSANIQILEKTERYNLYPFAYILPSGNIFMISDNRASILNPATFEEIRELPRIPGSPAGKDGETFGSGGRTYPNSGAAVIMPMLPPYTDPLEIMVCGGGTGHNKKAIGNCVRGRPEVAGDEWIIERMPYNRVMPNVVALPDLTFLIVNGAEKGVAGFATASDPVGTALIYDPAKPFNQRISVMEWTDIARMYHSGAELLHDGRVLISGSDPLDLRFPLEYRLQMFHPPYLLSGLPRPKFTFLSGNPDRMFQFGDSIRITASFPSGDLSKIRASIISPGVTTHGNHFGQRSYGVNITPGSQPDEYVVGPLPGNSAIMPNGNYLLHVLDGPTPSEGQWMMVGNTFPDLDAWPVGQGFSGTPVRSERV
ncbi:hypothetical protein HDU67_000245 [Dinochytrium kinnereticum]|nr:hypothetical protein HDU67_000245 [Dinochytrium kinnereticum]